MTKKLKVQIRMFKDGSLEDLEDAVNSFLRTLDYNSVRSVKYQSDDMYWSAMVVYEVDIQSMERAEK